MIPVSTPSSSVRSSPSTMESLPPNFFNSLNDAKPSLSPLEEIEKILGKEPLAAVERSILEQWKIGKKKIDLRPFPWQAVKQLSEDVWRWIGNNTVELYLSDLEYLPAKLVPASALEYLVLERYRGDRLDLSAGFPALEKLELQDAPDSWAGALTIQLRSEEDVDVKIHRSFDRKVKIFSGEKRVYLGYPYVSSAYKNLENMNGRLSTNNRIISCMAMSSFFIREQDNILKYKINNENLKNNFEKLSDKTYKSFYDKNSMNVYLSELSKNNKDIFFKIPMIDSFHQEKVHLVNKENFHHFIMNTFEEIEYDLTNSKNKYSYKLLKLSTVNHDISIVVIIKKMQEERLLHTLKLYDPNESQIYKCISSYNLDDFRINIIDEFISLEGQKSYLCDEKSSFVVSYVDLNNQRSNTREVLNYCDKETLFHPTALHCLLASGSLTNDVRDEVLNAIEENKNKELILSFLYAYGKEDNKYTGLEMAVQEKHINSLENYIYILVSQKNKKNITFDEMMSILLNKNFLKSLNNEKEIIDCFSQSIKSCIDQNLMDREEVINIFHIFRLNSGKNMLNLLMSLFNSYVFDEGNVSSIVGGFDIDDLMKYADILFDQKNKGKVNFDQIISILSNFNFLNHLNGNIKIIDHFSKSIKSCIDNNSMNKKEVLDMFDIFRSHSGTHMFNLLVSLFDSSVFDGNDVRGMVEKLGFLSHKFMNDILEQQTDAGIRYITRLSLLVKAGILDEGVFENILRGAKGAEEKSYLSRYYSRGTAVPFDPYAVLEFDGYKRIPKYLSLVGYAFIREYITSEMLVRIFQENGEESDSIIPKFQTSSAHQDIAAYCIKIVKAGEEKGLLSQVQVKKLLGQYPHMEDPGPSKKVRSQSLQ